MWSSNQALNSSAATPTSNASISSITSSITANSSSRDPLPRPPFNLLTPSNPLLYRQQTWSATTANSRRATLPSRPELLNLSSASGPLNLSSASALPSFRQQPAGAGALPPNNLGRVKVGVRVRPPFRDELSSSPNFYMAVTVPATSPSSSSSSSGVGASAPSSSRGCVALGSASSPKRREFMFDYAFGPTATQRTVFDTVARPIVEDVLGGFNGTVFAYGQTGTGKTYTMGILEAVNSGGGREEADKLADEDEDEDGNAANAGVIPRALKHIFEHRPPKGTTMQVTISFIQIYCETIQDLLSPATESINMQIREDPKLGFYVENLSEYNVASYGEAEALINLGLENRAMAPTLMNLTSSRSHTVLTIRTTFTKPTSRRKSKLLLVDLAGSERIRRTTSNGVRLFEAKSINTSLSALGNVIAALAMDSRHVPFRDSKLTRLLQDSLGGSAATALIATVGPAPINESESLSTLMFASRCMHVKSTLVSVEEVDYAELCTKLQMQLAEKDQLWLSKSAMESDRYEKVIHKLASELRAVKVVQQDATDVAPESCDQRSTRASSFNAAAAVDTVSVVKKLGSTLGFGKDSHDLVSASLDLTYKMLCQCADESASALKKYSLSYNSRLAALRQQYAEEEELEKIRKDEMATMESHDTASKEMRAALGPHLQTLDKNDARERVDLKFPDESLDLAPCLTHVYPHPPLTSFAATSDLMAYCESLLNCIRVNNTKLEYALNSKSSTLLDVKAALAAAHLDRRGREEEVVNWSFVLKYLLSTNSKLKRQLMGRESLKGLINGGSASVVGSSAASDISSRVGDFDREFANEFNARTERAVLLAREGDAAGLIQKEYRDRIKNKVGVEGTASSQSFRAPDATPSDWAGGRAMYNSGVVAADASARGVGDDVSVASSSSKSVRSEKVARALVDRVKRMTTEEIAALPETSRKAVQQLLAEIGVDKTMKDADHIQRSGELGGARIEKNNAAPAASIDIAAASPSFTYTPRKEFLGRGDDISSTTTLGKPFWWEANGANGGAKQPKQGKSPRRNKDDSDDGEDFSRV